MRVIDSPSKAGILRPYQSQLAANTDEEFTAGTGRIIAQMPTGAGKSMFATEVVARAVGVGQRVLFLAHRAELIAQFAATLARFNIPHGVIMANYAATPDAPVQVASVQTLWRRRDSLPPADLIVIDECHRTVARTYMDLVAAYPAARLLGLTATPMRLDGRGLGDVYDKLLVGTTAADLVKDGFLIDPDIYVGPSPDLRGVRVTAGDYNERDLAHVMLQSKLCGDIISHWSMHARERQTILFAVNCEHSRTLLQRFLSVGARAEHVNGTTPAYERSATLARYRSGETQVLCNVDVCTEGFDVPQTSAVILAAPTKSQVKYLQAAGRVMRPAPGKTDAVILDHAGCSHVFGHPTDNRVYRLHETSDVAGIAKQKCLSCGNLVPLVAGICPLCDSELESPIANDNNDGSGQGVPEESAAELVKLERVSATELDDRAAAAACPRCARHCQPHTEVGQYIRRMVCACGRRWHLIDTGSASRATPLDKKRQWVALQVECAALGFKPGWAAYQYKDLWGTWPRWRAA